MLNENFKLNIATGISRKSTTWKNIEVTWKELVNRLSKTVTTFETLAQYHSFDKDKQSDIKDVGGFVGGYLKNGKRRKENVMYKTILTLDIDYGVKDMWSKIYDAYKDDFTYLVYSTHKNTPDSPRLRLIVPLDKKVSPEEYEAIGRKIASKLGMDYFDDTTYEATRLMFYPSTPKDQEFFFKFVDAPLLNADKVLAEYEDWKDCSTWAVSSRSEVIIKKEIKKHNDNPINKDGIIGAFCKTYNIEDAISYFLKDIYLPTRMPNRYTYVDGSTSGGLVIYEDNFAYSNHATDKTSGKLLNSFDLVRIHLFSDLDDNKNENDTTKLPSFKKMLELVVNDDRCKAVLNEERFKEISNYFEDEDTSSDVKDEFLEELFSEDKKENLDWMKELELTKTGTIVPSTDNILTILNNDPNIKGMVGLNLFNGRCEIKKSKLPWSRTNSKNWDDIDDSGLRVYLEKCYKIEGRQKILDALNIVMVNNKFNPILDYLNNLPKWDGTKRVETLLVDYLGAEDNEYVREVTTKFLIAAITRIANPGCKFDNMLVLNGDQGIGKSYLFKRLAGDWFSDTLTNINGKESYEALENAWILEMAELSAAKKADIETIKHYLSKQVDSYRKAYARNVSDVPRHNVFVGSTNETGFLNDRTGARRFWIVECKGSRRTKTIWDNMTDCEVNQIWSEAFKLYKAPHDSINFLSKVAEEKAKDLQEKHTIEDYRIGIIEDFLNIKVPIGFNKMAPEEREVWYYQHKNDPVYDTTYLRKRVCAVEIHVECFKKEAGSLKKSEAKNYNDILIELGWVPIGPRKTIYGSQKCFERPNTYDKSKVDLSFLNEDFN